MTNEKKAYRQRLTRTVLMLERIWEERINLDDKFVVKFTSRKMKTFTKLNNCVKNDS